MKVFLFILSIITLVGCDFDRGSGRYYKKGKKGGCYYVNSKGNKVYVDRNNCY